MRRGTCDGFIIANVWGGGTASRGCLPRYLIHHELHRLGPENAWIGWARKMHGAQQCGKKARRLRLYEYEYDMWGEPGFGPDAYGGGGYG